MHKLFSNNFITKNNFFLSQNSVLNARLQKINELYKFFIKRNVSHCNNLSDSTSVATSLLFCGRIVTVNLRTHLLRKMFSMIS
jgi:hypothetical protein